MNILIVLGHPDKKSFNHAIAELCRTQLESNGHICFFHDLYAEEFSPVEFVNPTSTQVKIDALLAKHISDLTACDGIIVIHPNWWGQLPAIVKGWLDRVLLPGVAYDFVCNEKDEFVPVGLLKAKTGLVLNTSNSPTDVVSDPLETIWKNKVLSLCGVNNIQRRNFGLVKDSDKEQRELWLLEVQQLINSLFPSLK